MICLEGLVVGGMAWRVEAWGRYEWGQGCGWWRVAEGGAEGHVVYVMEALVVVRCSVLVVGGGCKGCGGMGMCRVVGSFVCGGCMGPVTGTGCTGVDIGGSAGLELVDRFCCSYDDICIVCNCIKVLRVYVCIRFLIMSIKILMSVKWLCVEFRNPVNQTE